MSREHNRGRRLIAIALASIIGLSLFAARIVFLNAEIPSPQVIEFKQEETATFENLSYSIAENEITIEDIEFETLEPESLCSADEFEEMFGHSTSIPYKVVAVEMSVSNNADRSIEVPLYFFRLAGPSWSATMHVDLFKRTNSYDEVTVDIEPHESKRITLHYVIHADLVEQLNKPKSSTGTHLVLANYPKKYSIELSA